MGQQGDGGSLRVPARTVKGEVDQSELVPAAWDGVQRWRWLLKL